MPSPAEIRQLERPEAGLAVAPAARLRLLRLSVTDLCNFRCCYCMPPEGVPKVGHRELLSLEQLADLAEWLTRHSGVERIKLTGGEPLVRKAIEYLVARLSAIPGVSEVSLTTNGSLLPHLAEKLKLAGLKRVNISLDSLDPVRFQELTRGGRLADTLAGVETALAVGLVPVKINAVLQRSSWERELPSLLDYAAARGLELRFIELMRTGTEREWCNSEFVSLQVVQQWLERGGQVEPLAASGGAPARLTRVSWRGTTLTVGWITPRSHPFCEQCERMRLDARGRLRRCLMDPAALDLAALRRDQGDAMAVEAFHAYLADKHPPGAMESSQAMSLIGG
jgi:cyclic pyranopterin phosphate synthase